MRCFMCERESSAIILRAFQKKLFYDHCVPGKDHRTGDTVSIDEQRTFSIGDKSDLAFIFLGKVLVDDREAEIPGDEPLNIEGKFILLAAFSKIVFRQAFSERIQFLKRSCVLHLCHLLCVIRILRVPENHRMRGRALK